MEESSKLGLQLLFYEGLRIAEAITLEWRDVDFAEKTLSVRPENQKLTLALAQAKSAETYVVSLSTRAEAPTQARADEEPVLDEGGKPAPWMFASAQSKTKCLPDKALGRAMVRLWKPERKEGQSRC